MRAFGVGEVVESPLEQAVRIVPVDAVFDAASAARMIARLAAMGCERVALDFGRAREVSDAALAMVASAVARKECPQVSLRGLGKHQERILRYLGVERVASKTTRARARRRRSPGTT